MEVAEVESFAASIPLDGSVPFATRTVEERDHASTYVRTADGTEGLGVELDEDVAAEHAKGGGDLWS